MKLRLGLGFLLLFMLAGRFLPGPGAWGFNHLAYLPGVFVLLWVLIGALFMVPAVQMRFADSLARAIPTFLFESRAGRWILPPLSAAFFILLRERSFFMGDGYLVGELVDRGIPFRAFDGLDYLLHFQIAQSLKTSGSTVSSFDVYRIGAVLVGILAAGFLPILVRRLAWEPWRKAGFLLLFFLQGPIVFFFGYVESYGFLFLFLALFMVAGLLVLQQRGSLWVAATFFGLALVFHLTALFTAPALLYLALRAPLGPAAKRWLQAAAPPAALFAIGLALHVAEGYNATWFHREFIESQNARSIWIPLREGRGIFTLYHWKDLFNLGLITAPVCLFLVLNDWRRIMREVRRPETGFLITQIGVIAILTLVIDKKLGGARDWDLLAAHSTGLVLLASMLLPADAGETTAKFEASPSPSAFPQKAKSSRKGAPAKSPTRPVARPAPVVGAVIGTALLVASPWILLLHLEERSIQRFVEVAADFPNFARAYAYEEVGKYYRKADNMDRAVEMYERCVQAYPGNPRFRVLLGSVYFMRGDMDKARAEYAAAIEKDPANSMATEMLGKVALEKQDFPTAVKWFQKLVEQRPDQASGWEMLGYSAGKSGMGAEAVRGYARAMELDSTLDDYHDLGVALLQLQRYPEAVKAFREAVKRGNSPARTRLALAWSLTEAAAGEGRAGRIPPEAWINEADGLVRGLLKGDSSLVEAADLQRRLETLKRISKSP